MRILFFDIETYTISEDEKRKYQGFRLGTANLVEYRPDRGWTDLDKLDFMELSDFHAWFDTLLKKKSVLFIISANIWFDLRTSELFFHMIDTGFEVKIFHAKNMCSIYKLKKGDCSVTCLNMQQFIPTNVKKMGDLVGLPKMDVDVFDPDDKLIMEYCRRDTDIITEMFKVWIQFITEHDLGKFCYTQASQAFTAFRHRFMNEDIYIHTNKVITPFERECFYGGRTEMFYQGKIDGQKTYKLDVNSMYPTMMKNYPMPVEWIDTHYMPGVIRLHYSLLRYLCFAKVALDTNEPAYPMKTGKKLIFPVGKFTTYLSHPELVYAIENNHVFEVEYLVTYKKAVIFKEYIDYFYGLRCDYRRANNDIFVYLTKLLMNSLYGKFGQKNDTLISDETMEDIKYETNTVIDYETGQRYKELWLGKNRKVFKEANAESINSFVAIPAMITSLARLHLWKLIKKARIENVYYCDTDSLFVNQAGYEALQEEIHQSELGKLATEKETTTLELFGPKDYIFDKEVVTKGIRKDATKEADGSYSQIQFPGFKGDIKHGFDKPYGIVKVNKTLRRVYEKGVVGETGRITPFVLSDY